MMAEREDARDFLEKIPRKTKQLGKYLYVIAVQWYAVNPIRYMAEVRDLSLR